MAKDIVFFTTQYFRDEEGQRLKLKWFHKEMLQKCADERIERLLLLEPAGFGKTTNVGKHYPLHTMVVMNPRCQMIYGGKSASDAEARVSAMKAELEGNEELINDFGPFQGPIWRDDALMLAQGNHNVKDPTISAVGSTSSIFGRRATHFIGDDMVTNLNSGNHVKPETRERFAQDFKQGIQKVAYAGRPLYIRIVNTVVDQRDLLHDLGDINQHAFTDTTWTSSKRYFVIRRPALDELTDPMTSLWPERRSVESLLEEKAEDLLAFEKRMQNRTLDPSMMNFQRIWFDGDPGNRVEIPGCLDYGRCLHQDPMGDGIPPLTRTGGYDPNPGVSENSKYSAYADVAFDRKASEPRTYWVTDIARFRAQIEEQAQFCVDRTADRSLALLYIENNVANQWLLQVNSLKTAALSYPIKGHHTNVKNKPDPEVGIPAMAGRIRAGRIRFPYHCPRCRAMTDLIIGEFLSYPQGATSDMMMALWMAILAAESFIGTTRNGIINRVISPFLAQRGITAAGAERFFPPRNIVGR